MKHEKPGSAWGFNLAFTALAVTAVVSAVRLAFNLGYHYRVFKCTQLSSLNCYLSMEGSYILFVTLALLLSVVGLWSRRKLGLCASLLALAGLGEVYRQWYQGTLSTMEMFGAKTFSELQEQQQHLISLYNATWWDIAVLVVALIVFIWHLTTLRPLIKPLIKNLGEPIRRRSEFRRKDLRVSAVELEQPIIE